MKFFQNATYLIVIFFYFSLKNLESNLKAVNEKLTPHEKQVCEEVMER